MLNKENTALLWVLVIAFSLRLLLAGVAIPHPERAYTPDTPSYVSFAKAILNGQGWTYPSAIRTPAYPLFLASIIALFGENAFVIIVLQSLISVATVGLTYWLAAQYFEKRIALLSAVLIALSLESITHTFYLLTETLFTVLFLAAMIFLLRARQTANWKYGALSGALLGLGILTRPMVLYYPVLALVLLFWDRTLIKKRLWVALAFLFSCGLVVGPWVARNTIVIGIPTVSTISNDSWLYYNAASLQARQTGQSEDIIRNELSVRVKQMLSERQLPDNEASRARVEGELAKQIIFSDPVRYVVLHLKNDLNSLLPDTDLLEILGINAGQKGTLNILKQQGLLPAIQHYFDGNFSMILLLFPFIFLLGITYLGCGFAIYFLILERRLFQLSFLSFPILYSLLLSGSASNPRFRVPVMPFLVILSATGLFALVNHRRSKSKSRKNISHFTEKNI